MQTLTVYVEKEDVRTLLKHGEVHMGPTYLTHPAIEIVIALNPKSTVEAKKIEKENP